MGGGLLPQAQDGPLHRGRADNLERSRPHDDHCHHPQVQQVRPEGCPEGDQGPCPPASKATAKTAPAKRAVYKSETDRDSLLGTWTKTAKGSLFTAVGVWEIEGGRWGLYVDHVEDEPRGTYANQADALRHADRLVNGVQIRRYARSAK